MKAKREKKPTRKAIEEDDDGDVVFKVTLKTGLKDQIKFERGHQLAEQAALVPKSSLIFSKARRNKKRRNNRA